MNKGEKCIYLTNKYLPKKIIAYFLYDGGENFQPYHKALITTNERLALTINSHQEAIDYYNKNPGKINEIIFVDYLCYLYPYSQKKDIDFDERIKYYNDRREYLIDDYFFYYEIGEKILLDTITLNEIKSEYRKKYRNLLWLKFKRFTLKPLFGIFFYDLMNLWKWYREFYEVEDKLINLKSSLKNVDQEMWIHRKSKAEVSREYKIEIDETNEKLIKKEAQILSANKNLLSLIVTIITVLIAALSFVINSWVNENRRIDLVEAVKDEKNKVMRLEEENLKLKKENKSLSEKFIQLKK
ncbi:hypothetical protein [Leptospira sp. GIMC2001]|uniref:hypothetical protein n=1 Tax=Leptospira sp. GIMC2001 TaxID=1513297 RepID=UPI002349B1F6|nr:hypothetical protein [Leptospira sp. GIMC2001]WCL51058.1 hypothetical protein O4O04_09660 [Leptospira sp. GIMC2001]